MKDKETTEQMIMRVSGMRPSECDCTVCRNMCRTPCLGTRKDLARLIKAGYGSRIERTVWAVGMLLGLTAEPILMLQPKQEANGWCTFRMPDGRCELHDKGLKPLEGRLASCRLRPANWSQETDFTWIIAKDWLHCQELFIVQS